MICNKRAKEHYDFYQSVLLMSLQRTHRNIDILLPVANRRNMIILMKRDNSFIFLTGLSSVSRSRRVNSSSSAVRISTVRDSAKNAWSQKLLRVLDEMFSQPKVVFHNEIVGMFKNMSHLQGYRLYKALGVLRKLTILRRRRPVIGTDRKYFWIFLRASTLRAGSLLSILDIVSVISSGTSARGSTSGWAMPLSRGDLGWKGGFSMGSWAVWFVDTSSWFWGVLATGNWEMLVRGRPSREGSMLRGLAFRERLQQTL